VGVRTVVVKQSAAESIAEISWYLESEGLLATAEKFTDDAYNFIEKLGDSRKGYRTCREPIREALGFKCIPYKKKYTIVFIELDAEIIICEFILSKRIYW
jgi:plasmid stabilization system protein ParE